jgi:hypothetical protein
VIEVSPGRRQLVSANALETAERLMRIITLIATTVAMVVAAAQGMGLT